MFCIYDHIPSLRLLALSQSASQLYQPLASPIIVSSPSLSLPSRFASSHNHSYCIALAPLPVHLLVSVSRSAEPLAPVTLRSPLSHHSRTQHPTWFWVFVLCALHHIGDCQCINVCRVSNPPRYVLFYFIIIITALTNILSDYTYSWRHKGRRHQQHQYQQQKRPETHHVLGPGMFFFVCFFIILH